MSEQYRFMRYYLPGSLFLIYLMILIIPNLSAEAIEILSDHTPAIIGIFTGAFVASPIIGYLVYAPYNYVYEHWAGKRTTRGALRYIEDLEFVNDNDRAGYQKNLRCITQKKEFLDLVYHSTLKKNVGEIKIDPKIVETLKNIVSNFAARIVCGFFVPLFCLFLVYPSVEILKLFGLTLELNIFFLLVSILFIGALSFVLLLDSKRVLYEAYQLEEYMVKAKKEEIKKLLKKLFIREPQP